MSTSASQSNRPIRLLPPSTFDDDVLLLKGFQLVDGLSRAFELSLEIQSLDPNVPYEKLISKTVNIEIDLPTNQRRYLSGIIVKFDQVGFEGQFANYRAVVVPWLWLLKKSLDCRIFQNLSVPDIVLKVFKDRGFSDYKKALTKTYPPRKYYVQYNESDFQFVSRLMEEVGIFYYFEHQKDVCTMVLCDTDTPDDTYPGYGSIPYNPQPPGQRVPEHIYNWKVENCFVPASAAVSGYDFENPKQLLRRQRQSMQEAVGHQIERYEFEDFVQTPQRSEEIAGIRAEEIASEQTQQFGESDALGICVGFHFKLTNYPRTDQNNKSYLITSLNWMVSSAPFTEVGDKVEFSSCAKFGAIGKSIAFRPPRITPKARIPGPQTAVVVGTSTSGDASGADSEVYTNSYGSVRVKFPWDHSENSGDACSCWIRVAQIWAGKNWGSMFIPHVGDEVIVSFENGDPDRPIVVGRVYNADKMPAADPSSTTNIGSIQDIAGNYIKLDSTSGAEAIKMYSPNNNTSWVLGPKGVKAETAGPWAELIKGQKISNVLGLAWNFVLGLYTKFIVGMDFGINVLSKIEFIEAFAVKCTLMEEAKTTKLGQFIAYPKKLDSIGTKQATIAVKTAVIGDKKETIASYSINAATYAITCPKHSQTGGTSSEDWTFNKSIMATNIKLTGIALTSVSSDVTTNVKGSVAVNITGAIINIG